MFLRVLERPTKHPARWCARQPWTSLQDALAQTLAEQQEADGEDASAGRDGTVDDSDMDPDMDDDDDRTKTEAQRQIDSMRTDVSRPADDFPPTATRPTYEPGTPQPRDTDR